jgi:glycosyltransferase involved in cell wall biosynthesis
LPLSVDLLLATYNSGRYLDELLLSLLNQEFSDFHIIARDDGSSDNSVEILRSFEGKFGNRLHVIEGAPSGSAKANFATLLGQSRAEYTLFVDADDVWDRDKVWRTVSALRELECRYGSQVPAYVFSDVRVIDGSGRLTHESFWQYKKIDPKICDSLSKLLVCPPMLGCASGSNLALNRLSLPMPLGAVTGHDWWMILVASIFGNIKWLEKPSMSYRIHGQNSSAQKKITLLELLKRSNKAPLVQRGLRLRREQAGALLTQFGDALPAPARSTLERFVAIGGESPLSRRLSLAKGGFLYPDWQRNLAMLLAC